MPTKKKRTVRHPKLQRVRQKTVKVGRIGLGAVKVVNRIQSEKIRVFTNNIPDTAGFNSKESDESTKASEVLEKGIQKVAEKSATSPRQLKKVVKKTTKSAKKLKRNVGSVRNGVKITKSGINMAKEVKKGDGIRRLRIKQKTVNTSKRKINNAPRKIRTTSRTAKGTKKLRPKLKAKSVKSARLAVSKTFKQSVASAQKVYQTKKAAAELVKTTNTAGNIAFRITVGIGKATISAIRSIIELLRMLSYFGAVIVIIVVIIAVIMFILSSAFGIFIPNDESTLTMREAVSRVNTEYNNKVNQLIEDNDDGDIDLIRYEGKRMQWKYVIAVYAAKYSNDDGDVMTINEDSVKKLSKVFFDMHDIYISFSQQDSEHGTIFNVLTVSTNAKTMSEIMDKYNFNKDQRIQVRDILDSRTEEQWTALLYGIDGMNSSTAFVQTAREQVGTVGGQIYTTWYGYEPQETPKEWSGIFVSWCADQVGLISQGLFPQFSNVNTGAEWFKNNGMWQEPASSPSIGDIAFMDYNGDGIADRCFIVTKVLGSTAFVIGAVDEVYEGKISLSSNNFLLGYGMLPQMSGLNGDTVEEQCYNYLRAEGYSEIAACAVIANFHGECNCDPGIYGHDYGEAAGIMQWTGPNKTIFFNWCNDNAMNWTNLESQLYFYSYWLNDINNGEWSRISGSRHPDFQHVYSTEEFKQISADTYGGDIARALYEATAMFVDDMERPYDTWGAETRRYTYAVQFYNYLVAGGVDGTSQSAWRPEYANDIGVFHLN